MEKFHSRGITSDALRLPEVQQFLRLINDIRQRFDEGNTLSNAFNNLTLGQS